MNRADLPCDRRSEAEQVDDLNVSLRDDQWVDATDLCAFLAGAATVLALCAIVCVVALLLRRG